MSILNSRLPIGTDLGYSVLDGGIDNSQTTIAVAASAPFPVLDSTTNRRRFIPAVICPAADPATCTFADLQSGEHIVITDHASGSTDLSVIRGDSPISHVDGSLIMILPTAQVWDSMFSYLRTMESVLAAYMGAPESGEGIILNYGVADSSFKATQSVSPNMTVQIAAGIGAYQGQVFKHAAGALTFVAPVLDTRIDLIVYNLIEDNFAIIAGTEGGAAPTVDPDTVALWEVTLDVAQTAILNADLADVREFA